MRLYGETYTFSLFDKQFHIRDRARELGVHKHLIPLEPMQIHILNIEKTMNIAIKKQVLNDFNKGLIQLFTTESNFVLPTAVPVYLESTKDANKIRAIVNLSAYAKLSKDEFGNITEVGISDNLLFTLMCTAWFYRRWVLEESRFASNLKAVKTASEMYSSILYRVLDVKYSVGTRYSSIDATKAALAYFFANYFIDSKYAEDVAANLSNVVDKNGAIEEARLCAAKYKSFENFEGLAKMLNETIDGLKNVEPLIILSEFGRLYNGSAVPALDYLPFFMMIIFSAYLTGGIGKDLAINSIVKTDADMMIKLISEIYSK